MDAPTQQRHHSAQLDSQFYSLLKISDSTLLSNKLQQLCASGFNVRSIYGGHTTAISVASEYRNEKLVRLLLTSYGAQGDILKPDRVDGDTAIHTATIGGSIAVLCLLESTLERRIVIKNNYDHTPLHHALGMGALDMARHWIERDADLLESQDWTGAIPFHFAARNGKIDVLELVKERHAAMDVSRRSTAGLTALHYAAWNGKDEAVKWLVREGSDLEAVDLVERNTALHWAAMRGHRRTIEELVRAHVRQGVEVFKKNKENKTVLELLDKYFPVEELHALIELVEEEGLLDMKAFPPMVLVKYVMGHGNSSAIRKLERSLAYAAENCKSEDYTANLKKLLEDKLMIWLAKIGRFDLVPLLMKMENMLPGGFLPQTAASALNHALLNEKFDFAKALAEHGKERLPVWIRAMKAHLNARAGTLADKLDTKDKELLTTSEELKNEIPLAFWVFQDRRKDVAKFLTEQEAWGALINEQGPKTRRTALHWAYKFDRTDIVASLLEVRGCDPDIRDKDRKSPIRYAVALRREERQVFVDALNAIIVGAALIAGISFNGLVQPPLGYRADPKVHVNLSSSWMKAFWISNSSSFFLAMASALMALRGVLPRPDIQLDKVVYSIQTALRWASTLLFGSITFALIAFGSAGMAVLLTSARVYMAIPTALGGLGCVFILFWFIWGNRSLWFPTEGKEQSGASQAPEVEGEQDVPVDNVREPKYKTGPRYLEYPWEDGLDELDLERWQRRASSGSGSSADSSETHVQTGSLGDSSDSFQPHVQIPIATS